MLDVVIIGGGICGCSLLYELSRYRVRALLVEKENDLTEGATKANSAIVHAGYDPEPGTMMAKYNVEGCHLIEKLCADLDIMYRKNGSLVLGFDEADRATIEKLYERGVVNGVPDLRILEYDELHEKEPATSANALCALYAPSAGIVSPWELAFAQAQTAVKGGAEVRLETEVLGIRRKEGHYSLRTTAGDIKTRFVVNAAGCGSDLISRMLGEKNFTIKPTRGQYYLLDTTQGEIIKHVIFQCPSKDGKGVLVSPTVHGNLIVGPNAEPSDSDDLATTAKGQDFVRKNAVKSVPSIEFHETIRNFSGIRAATEHADFIIGESKENPGYFNIAGIKSPGLTSAPAIAKDLALMLGKAGLKLEPNPNFQSRRSVLRFNELSDKQRAEVIRKNPLYGTIVCRCRTVTEGEIVDALHEPLPPLSLGAVKRRCTPGSGRCQGGFCGPRVQAIIARELGIPQTSVPLDRAGMDIVFGRTKESGSPAKGGCSHE